MSTNSTSLPSGAEVKVTLKVNQIRLIEKALAVLATDTEERRALGTVGREEANDRALAADDVRSRFATGLAEAEGKRSIYYTRTVPRMVGRQRLRETMVLPIPPDVLDAFGQVTGGVPGCEVEMTPSDLVMNVVPLGVNANVAMAEAFLRDRG